MKKALLTAALLVAILVAPHAQAQTNDDIIADLLAQIAALQAQLAGMTSQPAGTFTHTLRVGSTDTTTGGEVTMLQTRLRDEGHYTYPSITGYFGGVTEAAVKSFQAANGLPTVGIVGPSTRAALNQSGTNDFVEVTVDTTTNDGATEEIVWQKSTELSRLLSPNGGEVWKRRTIETVHWTYDIADKDEEVDLIIDELDPSCVEDFDIDADRCEPSRSYNVYLRSRTDGAQTWDVGESFDNISRTEAKFGHFLMRIKNRDSGLEITSDAPFEIAESVKGLNRAPEIHDFDGPDELSAGEMNTWMIVASDQEEDDLTFQIDWGDGTFSETIERKGDDGTLEASFDHIYDFDHVGELVARVIVTDEEGAKAYHKKEIEISRY